MRLRNHHLALAVAVSLAVHLLLWPAARHIIVHGWTDGGAGPSHHTGEITLLLNPPPDAPATVKKPAHRPVILPDSDPPDDMGKAAGKGTGAQAAKGDRPLIAREGGQDQAFLSRDPVGQGRVGDLPTQYTGPRGQDGNGGQRGAAQAAADAPAQPTSPAARTEAPTPPADPAKPANPHEARPPRSSPVQSTEVEVPSVLPPPDAVAPPPAPTASAGAAKADITVKPADEIKAPGLITTVVQASDGTIAIGSADLTAAPPTPASSTAPPVPRAPAERMAVVMAAPSALPPAPVAAPPPPAIPPSPAAVKSAAPPAKPAPPRPVAPPAAAALLQTGDGRAPGKDHTSADPAQESDSESDPFSKVMSAVAFQDGRLEVRHGRKVKTTRPHFLPGAMAAFIASPDATVVLKIAIDETGNVKSADIIRSAGSVEIDQPCRVAVYDWWFEPSHDKHGRPVPDVMVFTIHFR